MVCQTISPIKKLAIMLASFFIGGKIKIFLNAPAPLPVILSEVEGSIQH